MNALKKTILIGSFLLATNASAFGHIDLHKLRDFAMLATAGIITACTVDIDDPECEFILAGLSPKIIESARHVTVCWDLPSCKESSVANFAAICESDSECRQTVGELAEHQVHVFEECMINHECKTSMKSCLANRSCRANFDACMANPSNDNLTCEAVFEIYPEGFLEKFIE